MKYSEVALFLLAAQETKLIKSNAKFWNEYSSLDFVYKNMKMNKEICEVMDSLRVKLCEDHSFDGFICAFDPEFPIVNNNVKKKSEKPYLIFYKGDISLLKNLNNNVAVIGCTDPTPEIVEREKVFVKKLIEKDMVIVSGLAKGCDSVAHKLAVEKNKQTIAILPCDFKKIFPKENRNLAIDIVNTGGLLISEYYSEPESRFEAINRFIQRDRLQAIFAKTIILAASYRKNEGDSGSRHAMEYAKNYQIKRYVLLNDNDINDKQFGLNVDINKSDPDVSILTAKSIDEIKKYNFIFEEKKDLTQMELFKI